MLVRFQDVAFTHSGRPAVLTGFNLSVEAGEMIAIVGRSGAGKTTVLKLVNRLLLPTSGTVFVEGRNTSEWDGIRLRRRVGYVFQEDRKSTRLNSSHQIISYAVFCLKKK